MHILYGYGHIVIQGTLMTLGLAALSTVCATVIGIAGGLGKASNSRIVRWPAIGYTTAIRSVPDLVLMMIIFYNVQKLVNWLCELVGIQQILINPFSAGVITLAFIYGAYMTETFRGAFEAVPRGQVEAGISTGMSSWQVFRIIKLPQMVRFAMPSYRNNVLVLMKATALVSIIGLTDIIAVTQQAGRATQHLFFFNIVAAAIYLAFTCATLAVLSLIGKRYNAGVKEASL